MVKSREIRTFEGATAIVTGGASGIGRGLAEELAKRGANVVIADIQYELAKRVGSQKSEVGSRIAATKLDTRNAKAVEKLVKDIARRYGRLDYIFNNAGIAIASELKGLKADDWERTIDVNLKGVIYGLRAAYSIMRKQSFGHIVNTASMAGLAPVPGLFPTPPPNTPWSGFPFHYALKDSNTACAAALSAPG